MRLAALLIFPLALFFAACDSNDEGDLSDCRFEMEFTGALEGRVSGRAFFTISQIGPADSLEYMLEFQLEPRTGDSEVLFDLADTTCRIIPGGVYPGITAHLGVYPEEGSYRTGHPPVQYLGVTANLDAVDCGAQLLSVREGTLSLDRVTEDRIEGTFEAPVTVTYGSRYLETSVTSRFNARLFDDTIADCYGN